MSYWRFFETVSQRGSSIFWDLGQRLNFDKYQSIGGLGGRKLAGRRILLLT